MNSTFGRFSLMTAGAFCLLTAAWADEAPGGDEPLLRSAPASLQQKAVKPPSVIMLGSRQAQSVLGKQVRSSANENMGRIVDVIVDPQGRVRAAVIDFGGFLGVGSRKIVVDWNALRFGKIANKKDSITLELTKAQVAAAPEYKEDAPVIVLGAAGRLQPWDFDR